MELIYNEKDKVMSKMEKGLYTGFVHMQRK